MQHSIKIVSRRTGLSPHVIRIWEKRYGAVTPGRTDTNRRFYDDQEVERLRLLRELTIHGHSIGRIAQLPREELQRMLGEDRAQAESRGEPSAPTPKPEETLGLSLALDAIRNLDPIRLERFLNEATLQYGQSGLLQQVIIPLVQEIGDRWESGEIKIAHEHIATAVIRTFLGNFVRPYGIPASAPSLLVTTPSGQLHELGAILVAAAATIRGWRVIYLGPSLPAEEIAGATRQHRARAVALSIVYPKDDPLLPLELIRLRKLLPPETGLLVGGRAATGYANSLREAGAVLLQDLPGFCSAIDDLRTLPKEQVA